MAARFALLVALLTACSGCALMIPPAELGLGVAFGGPHGPEVFLRTGVAPLALVRGAQQAPVDVSVGGEFVLGAPRDRASRLYLDVTGTFYAPGGEPAPRLRGGADLVYDFGLRRFGGGLVLRGDLAWFADFDEGDPERDGGAQAWGETSFGSGVGAFLEPDGHLALRLDARVRVPAVFGGVGLQYVPTSI